MAEPLELSLEELDFDLDALLASIPPDFDFGVDGVLMNVPLVDGTKTREDHLSLELPVVVDPPLEPAAPDVKSQDCCLDSELPEVAESTVDSAVSDSPQGSDSTWAEELERFLLDEYDEDGGDGPSYLDDGFFLDEFFSDAAVEGSADESIKQLDSGGEHAAAVLDPATPASCASASASPEPNLEEAPQVENSESLPERRRGRDDEDPLEKKRRRQLRNRDSAMKSRERRKMYIQDLEKRSKSLEMECRRLEHLLYSAAAENHALHQRLQRDRTIGSATAKQESAVLFAELLLLGSLFWLANIMVLLLAPNLLAQNLKSVEGARELDRNLILEGISGAKRPECRRKYRALRTKMKMLLALSVT